MTVSSAIAGIGAFPPGLVLVLAAAAIPLLRPPIRQAVVLAMPLVALWWVWQVPDGPALTGQFLGHEIVPVMGGKLGRLFATVFAIMAFASALFSMNQSRAVELSAAFLYAGSAIGVALAGDLITMFVFWELMAIGSTVVIWSAETAAARKAAMRYVTIHLFGGVLLMTGVIGQIAATGSTAFVAMQPDSFATWMILAGFLINAGAPPLSPWVPDAYPEATPAGAVFLSAFTTKTAVYVLLTGFPGAEILIFFGLFMVFHGIVYALRENDARRVLAYSIISQVGFMVTAAGIGSETAVNGAAAHAFAHILYKALLMMAAGSVVYATGRHKLTELGGLYRSMPLTAACSIVGALAIAGFPLTSGFVTKSMITQAAADAHLLVPWLLLTAGSAATFLYVGLRLHWLVYFHRDAGLKAADPPLPMRLAMILLAALCLLIGLAPATLYAILPYPTNYVPYTAPHVVEMLQLLGFAALAFVLCLPLLRPRTGINLDLDWFYRRLLWNGGRALAALVALGHRRFIRRLEQRVGNFIAGVFRHHGPEGALARTWPTGSTTLWVAVLLVVYLLVYYF